MLGTSTSAARESIATTFPDPIYRAGQAALSRPAQWRAFIVTLIVSDLLLTGLAFRVAYLVRFHLGLPFFQLDVTPSFPLYRAFALGLAVVWVAIFAANGLYQRRNLLGGTREYSHLFRAASTGMLLVVLAGF